MAMAPDSPSPGGKIGGLESSQECDLCGSTAPVKYCPECQFTLCHACSKGHGKIQSTKDHPLLEISMIASSASFTKSGDAESGPSQCAKHPDDVLDFYCEKCTVLICGKCRLDHKGHPVQSVKDDLKMYQNICTQHIKKLLDKTHDLEEHKSLVEGIFNSYDSAIQTVEKWKRELTELIEECSRSLREDLEKAKQEWETIVNDDEKGLNKMTEGVENQLSKLYSIRKVSDMDLFSHELAASQQLLEHVNHFMENILPTLTVPTVEEILPNLSELQTVKTVISDLMTSDKTIKITPKKQMTVDDTIVGQSGATTALSISTNTTQQFTNFDSLSQKSKISISDPDSLYGYSINSAYADITRLMIHGNYRKDIRIVNLDDNSIIRHTGECYIYNMISTASNQYIAVMNRMLYLLNSKFEILKRRTTGKICQGLSLLSDHTFLLLELEKKDGKYTTYISIVNIQNNRFSVTKETSFDYEENIFRIGTGEDKSYAVMCGNKHLCKVDLANWKTQHLDVSKWASNVWSMCVVGDQILLGDSRGRVHLMDKHFNYRKVILGINTEVRDIAVMNGHLIVSSVDNNLYIYK